MNGINRRGALGGLALALTAPRILRAQGTGGWQPRYPVQLVVGFAPGGGSDVIARTIAEATAPFVPQPMVVVNRPGAGGALAADQVARAQPDGHTLLLPLWLQTQLGYTATWAGLVAAPSGAVAVVIPTFHGAIFAAADALRDQVRVRRSRPHHALHHHGATRP